jgi:hypothetical protein
MSGQVRDSIDAFDWWTNKENPVEAGPKCEQFLISASCIALRFRRDGRPLKFALALSKPFARFLTTLFFFPMAGVLGFVREDEIGCAGHVVS